jgi:hypothetical protein
MIPQITNKLFYGKYPYKVKTFVKGASIIKTGGIKRIMNLCLGDNGNDLIKAYHSHLDPKALYSYCESTEEFILGGVHTRFEYNWASYYLETKPEYEKLHKKLSPWVVSITEPCSDQDLKQLIHNTKNIVICDKLPYEIYQYRIYLGTAMPISLRSNFLEWSRNYGIKIKISKSTNEWLQGTKYFLQDPFMYVEDVKLLSMIKLFLGQYARRTEEFLIR